jgi:hypothetical protein
MLAVLAGLLTLAACGGGSGGTTLTPATGTNVTPVVVDAGPSGTSVNLPFVSVTICIPGTTTCQTVNHILLDTGSTGLRIVNEALLSTPIALPQAQTAAGDPLDECLQFADGYTWGSVRYADVKIADGTASNIPIHLIGDPAAPAVPVDCPNGGPPENNVVAFGANGVLGLNVFTEDCGSACVTIAKPGGIGAYYGCPAGGCVNSTVALALQVQNPIYRFATNNNGVAIELPALSSSAGQLSVRGSLILGIDTQGNNQLGTATLLTVNATSGLFTTIYHGSGGDQTLPTSFIDSGSNALFFNDSTLPVCTFNTGFYCPLTVQQLSATSQSAAGVSSTVSFKVANADTLTKANISFSAFTNVAGKNPLAGSFDWGLPFFYGRRVYVGFEGRSASAGPGPYFAF